MRSLSYFFLASALVPIAVSSLHAQTTNSQNVGFPTNATLDGTGIESVQTNNPNLHIEIPLFALPGRGLSVPVSLVYDSKGWVGNAPLDSIATIIPAQAGHSILETWRVNAPLGGGQHVGVTPLGFCGMPTISKLEYYYQESNGTTHTFPPFCSPIPANLIYPMDSSGYAYHVDTGKLTNKAGVNIYYQSFQNTQQNVDVMEDANGNKITCGDSPQLGLASTVTIQRQERQYVEER